MSKFSSEFQDPRYFQVLYLGSFLFYGLSFLDWGSDWKFYALIVSMAVLTQLVLVHFTSKKYSSVKSALITALGLCLLLKVNSLEVAALAALLAISSKFLIRYKNKHIFNPANFGLIIPIILTQDAWVSPGQWGSEAILWFFVGSAGLMMILKVGRWDTAFTFLASFGLIQFVYVVGYLGWEPAVWLHRMSNGTLLLFTFFMITDPMTTPNHRTGRIIWAILLAVILFVASNYFFIQTAAIWILFLVSPLTPIYDKIFLAKKYEWFQHKEPEKIEATVISKI